MTKIGQIRIRSVIASAGGLVVFATLAYLNLDGYHNEPYGSGDFFGDPPDINWTHGWPFVCMVRNSVGTGPLVVRVVQRTVTSRWPFDGTPVSYFYRNSFWVDVAILVVLVGAVVWSIYTLVPSLPKRLSYGLKALFVLMTMSSVAAIGLPYLANRLVQYRFAMVVLAVAVMMVIVAVAN